MSTLKIHLGDTVQLMALAVLQDGTRLMLPAGTTCAFSLADPTVATMDNNGVGNPMQFTGALANKISDVRPVIHLPGNPKALPTSPAGLMVLPVPTVANPIVSGELVWVPV